MDIDFKIFALNDCYFDDHPYLTREAKLKANRLYLGVVIIINENNSVAPVGAMH